MNEVVAPTLLAEPRHETITHLPGGGAEISPSPELTCHYEPKGAVLWTTISPRCVPCFTPGLLHDMERCSQIVEGYFTDSTVPRPLRYIVIRSGIPKVFNVGGDLAYFQRLIAAQDRARLTEYARTAISVTYRNFMAHNLRGVTTIALLEGDALGGGLECALSCDVVMAEEHIKAGFPEILFDMFPGMGGLSFLTRRVGRKVVDQMTRSGRQYGARDLLDLGVVDHVVPTGEGREAVLGLMRQRENQSEGHAAMNAVDKLLHPVTLNELNDVVRLWVDCALRLSVRGQQWMRRLHQQQLATFGAANLALVQNEAIAATKVN